MEKKVCFMCKKRKSVYKLGSGWTLEDTGSKPVVCPVCEGKGELTSEDAHNIQKEVNKKRKKQ